MLFIELKEWDYLFDYDIFHPSDYDNNTQAYHLLWASNLHFAHLTSGCFISSFDPNKNQNQKLPRFKNEIDFLSSGRYFLQESRMSLLCLDHTNEENREKKAFILFFQYAKYKKDLVISLDKIPKDHRCSQEWFTGELFAIIPKKFSHISSVIMMKATATHWILSTKWLQKVMENFHISKITDFIMYIYLSSWKLI